MKPHCLLYFLSQLSPCKIILVIPAYALLMQSIYASLKWKTPRFFLASPADVLRG